MTFFSQHYDGIFISKALVSKYLGFIFDFHIFKTLKQRPTGKRCFQLDYSISPLLKFLLNILNGIIIKMYLKYQK